MSLVVLPIVLAIEVEIGEVSGTLVVALVVDFKRGIALERVVTKFDAPAAQAQRHFIDPVKDAHGAVLSDGALDSSIEEFIERLVTEFKLTEVLRAILETRLRARAEAAVTACVVFALDPDGELGVELFEAMDALFWKAQKRLKP